MACAYWKLHRAQEEACFYLFFRSNPFGGGFTVAAGLTDVIAYLRSWRFGRADLVYLGSLRAGDGKPLFPRPFLDHLGGLRFGCDLQGVPEGTLVFAHEPVLRLMGSILQCQILETPLLNLMNFQSLIATKACRIVQAATPGGQVIDFGLRRAQGPDGALSASRSAHLGGCHATSNVLAGATYSIPVRGTHAHSWVMSFDGEEEAFEAYAKAMPGNVLFLVDTYETIRGLKRAIAVALRLRRSGVKLLGIRLDSGDMEALSRKARQLLDEAGLEDAAIVASGDLDEYSIADLVKRKAPISIWGVGTRLITAHDQPALGGVYKLSAIRARSGVWRHTLKSSQTPAKSSNPGILQVRRFQKPDGRFLGDLIYDELLGTTKVGGRDLLVPIFRRGKLLISVPTLAESRQRLQEQLACLDPAVKRLKKPGKYPVTLDGKLMKLKARLLKAIRGRRGM